MCRLFELAAQFQTTACDANEMRPHSPSLNLSHALLVRCDTTDRPTCERPHAHTHTHTAWQLSRAARAQLNLESHYAHLHANAFGTGPFRIFIHRTGGGVLNLLSVAFVYKYIYYYHYYQVFVSTTNCVSMKIYTCIDICHLLNWARVNNAC